MIAQLQGCPCMLALCPEAGGTSVSYEQLAGYRQSHTCVDAHMHGHPHDALLKLGLELFTALTNDWQRKAGLQIQLLAQAWALP